jgi:hypothetical protein
MKKAILLSLAAAAALATAAPALAQTYDHPGYGQPSGYGQGDYGRPQYGPARFGGEVNDRIGFLFGRIDQSQRQGMINSWQARRLRGELGQVRSMAQRYRWQNGGALNDWQRAQVNQRLDGVAGQLRFDHR